VGRGVRQGDPLSPTLFNVFVDPLKEAISQCDEKEAEIPVTRGVLEARMLRAYADDVVLICDSPNHAQQALTRAETWLTQHGMRLNAAKSAAMVVHTENKDVARPEWNLRVFEPVPADIDTSLGGGQISGDSF